MTDARAVVVALVEALQPIIKWVALNEEVHNGPDHMPLAYPTTYGEMRRLVALAAALPQATGTPIVPNPCSVCGLPITGGGFRGTGDGAMRGGGSFAHDACYWRAEADRLTARVAKLEQATNAIYARTTPET